MKLARLLRSRSSAATAALLLAWAFTGCFAQTSIPPLKPEDPPYRGLDANLYMQTSAEYRACCLQAYNLATYRLKEKATAARAADPDAKLAVIMDLDETVVDNAGFEALQIRSGLSYDQRLWDLWELHCTNKVAFIPGAKEFIETANSLNVRVAYISNRGEQFRENTKQTLAFLGIPIQDEQQLQLLKETSDKTARRAVVESAYNVLLYVGDNLRDFKDSYKSPSLGQRSLPELQQAIEARKKLVDADRQLWGDKFIILPNPAYGEWLKPLGNGKTDLDLLVPGK